MTLFSTTQGQGKVKDNLGYRLKQSGCKLDRSGWSVDT